MSKFYKILPEDLICRGFQYREGLNIDTKKITPYRCDNGLHFADEKYILYFCDNGTRIAEVEIPKDAFVYHFDDQSKADRIILKNIRPLWSVDTIEALIREGVNFDLYKNFMLCEAAYNGSLETIQYLVENGADIHADNDNALSCSAQAGHLELVKYLVEQGADIHAYDDDALHQASEYGHFDIVKYLVEHGANIHAWYDYAIEFAKTPEIKKYLQSLK